MTDHRCDGSSRLPVTPVMRLFVGAPRPSGAAVLRSLPAEWKAKLIQIEPSNDLDFNIAAASLFFDLPGLNPGDFFSYDTFESTSEAYERFSTLVPMLTRWMPGLPEVRPWSGVGKRLIHGLARCSVQYIVADEGGEIGGVFTATLTRGEGSSTLLAADLLEWRRGLPKV